jgi:hypothetical protein
MKFEELRNEYPHFYYRNYHIEKSKDSVRIVYDFEVPGLSEFHPTFTIPLMQGAKDVTDTALFCNAAFSLGMVELISYWKCACPAEVTVECGHLNDEQILWWKKLYFNGLGEFFYKNEIHTDQESFMSLKSTGSEIQGSQYHESVCGNLIAVGGGKDSFVSLDLLKEFKDDNTAFIINPIESALNSAHAAGYREGNNLILCRRTLDKNMLELNKKGYLNGHTPFSAMAAFASYMTAVLYGKKYIVLSNEASANESTIKGTAVNHQYSKTFEFEKDFHHYCSAYLDDTIDYFSFLRPLSELQIAGLFSRMKSYLPIFRSCNVGQKEGKWCGHCAKCLFVALMMSAYLDDEEIISIFGRDMLNDETMKELFEQLTGILDDKPFECVGTRDEVNTAVCMSIAAHEKGGRKLPLLYEYYKTASYYGAYRGKTVNMLAYNNENRLPEQYAEVMKRKLREWK